jgi:hypothetical protein
VKLWASVGSRRDHSRKHLASPAHCVAGHVTCASVERFRVRQVLKSLMLPIVTRPAQSPIISIAVPPHNISRNLRSLASVAAEVCDGRVHSHAAAALSLLSLREARDVPGIAQDASIPTSSSVSPLPCGAVVYFVRGQSRDGLPAGPAGLDVAGGSWN